MTIAEIKQKAEALGLYRCDCGDVDGLPHCGWWFDRENRKAYIFDDLEQFIKDKAVESPIERCNTCGLSGTHAKDCTQLQIDVALARRLQATIDEQREKQIKAVLETME